jgi:hypothetical protein
MREFGSRTLLIFACVLAFVAVNRWIIPGDDLRGAVVQSASATYPYPSPYPAPRTIFLPIVSVPMPSPTPTSTFTPVPSTPTPVPSPTNTPTSTVPLCGSVSSFSFALSPRYDTWFYTYMYPNQVWSIAVAESGASGVFQYWATDSYGNTIGSVYTGLYSGGETIYSNSSSGYVYFYVGNSDYYNTEYFGLAAQVCNLSTSVLSTRVQTSFGSTEPFVAKQTTTTPTAQPNHSLRGNAMTAVQADNHGLLQRGTPSH